MNHIAFPGLGLNFKINPVAFTFPYLGKEVYWYGIIISLGVIIGTLVSKNAAKKANIKFDILLDLLLYGLPTALLCGRLYYCLFKLPYYIDNPSKIFAIWEGGIAIYGGIIGAIISTSIYCKYNKLPWRKIFDIGILGVITGQIIGRWGNFVNAEAYGEITNLPWRMEIISDSGSFITVHPTFLYESLWNLIGLFVLIYINNHKKYDGTTFYSYLIWYGIGRAVIEGLRTDSLYLGPLRISQIVGIFTAVLGIICIIYLCKKHSDTNL